MNTLILIHECFKWEKGMKKPKIISNAEDGRMVCSLCGRKAKGKLILGGKKKSKERK